MMDGRLATFTRVLRLFREFFKGFVNFSKFSDLLGHAPTCSDTFGCDSASKSMEASNFAQDVSWKIAYTMEVYTKTKAREAI